MEGWAVTAIHQQPVRTEKLTVLLTQEERRQIEMVRHQLELRGRRVSLSRVAVELIRRGLRQPAAV